jgi:hypothetical protein
MKFRSAVDAWFYAVFIPVIGAAVVIAPTLSALGGWRAVVGFAPLALVAGLLLWMLFGTVYVVADGVLTIRCGPFVWRIPLAAIRRVQASRSVASSPALSLKRLQIDYGTGESILVSPADRDGFLSAIGHASAARAL